MFRRNKYCILLQEKLILDHTPPLTLKAPKNEAELEGMKNSSV